MGLGGGLVMVLFFSVWPRVYGRAHLGRIQGAAQAMTVLASAIGPLLLAWCVEWTGSYAGMFNVLAAVIGLAAFSALMTPLPDAKPRPLDGMPSSAATLTPGRLADHRPARHASGRRITSTVITSSRPIHIASVNTTRLMGCRSAKLRHRTDLVEARYRRCPSVAAVAEIPVTRSAPSRMTIAEHDRERQHVEQEEHDHALHDRARGRRGRRA